MRNIKLGKKRNKYKKKMIKNTIKILNPIQCPRCGFKKTNKDLDCPKCLKDSLYVELKQIAKKIIEENPDFLK